jgi:hypothetical protein
MDVVVEIMTVQVQKYLYLLQVYRIERVPAVLLPAVLQDTKQGSERLL